MKNITTIFLLFFAVSLTFSQVDLGEKVPNFKALDQDGEKWVLKSILKKSDYLVIYFYPAAFTGGCTAQACSYRDQKGELAEVGASVAGVSGDSPETLKLFALEHSLNFTMLADESGEVAAIFDVPHGEGGTIQREIKGTNLDLTRGTTIQRWTFILDNEGTLIYKDTEVDAAGDSGKVLEFLSSLQ
ncbi:MAG: peroxiredoxin [Bacteroidetes bacterium]|nr:MAG: peroxiredoxin [Bacteroidota bacterium]